MIAAAIAVFVEQLPDCLSAEHPTLNTGVMQQDILCHPLQFFPKPAIERHAKPLFWPPEDLAR